MKLLICGSRSIHAPYNIFEEIDEYKLTKDDTIICGGAIGVDTVAIKYAEYYHIPLIVIDPDYEAHGSRAPLLRDAEMAKMCDKALAIWDGKSHGTKFTIDEVRKLGKEIKIVSYRKN